MTILPRFPSRTLIGVHEETIVEHQHRVTAARSLQAVWSRYYTKVNSGASCGIGETWLYRKQTNIDSGRMRVAN